MTTAEQRGARAAAAQDLGREAEDVSSSCSRYKIELAVDEVAGSVSVRLQARATPGQEAGVVHRCRSGGGEAAAARPLEPAEEGRTAGAGLQRRERQEHGELARARQGVRAGVVALLERAACLEGVPDNEPEVRGVRSPLALPPSRGVVPFSCGMPSIWQNLHF